MGATQLPFTRAAESPEPMRNNRSAAEPNDRVVAEANVMDTQRQGWYAPLKIAVDFVTALVLLVVTAPVIVIAAFLIKISSRGPVFYLQTRLGKAGRTYRVIKLRTMVDNAEEETGAVWSDSDDPRITAVGRFLRDTHIDEFPQLINVLFGQMSLVGPRPERPEFVVELEWQLPNYRERLQARPGITGLAQLKLPADSNIESVRRKLVHDLYYVRYQGPWLDLRILCVTGWLLTKTIFRGAWNLIALPTNDKVHDRLESIVSHESELPVAAGEVNAE